MQTVIVHIHSTVNRLFEKRFSIVISSELAARLDLLAVAEKRTVAELAEEMLWQMMAERLSAKASIKRDPWQALTPRERETAALACMGYTNREIARQMVISPNTVKTHMRHVLRKFSVSSKVQLRHAQAEYNFAQWIEAQPYWPFPARRLLRPESRKVTQQ